MSSLILPRRFTNQPQGAVELAPDWADCVLSASIGGSSYNIKTGNFDTRSGVGVSSAPSGVVDAPTGNAYVVENATLGRSFLVIASITPTSLTGIKQILSWDNSEITAKRYFQFRNNGSNLEMVRFNSAASAFTASASIGIGINESGVVAGWSNGGEAGVLTTSSESSVTVTSDGKDVPTPAGEQLWFTRFRTTGGAIYEPTDNRFALRVVMRDPGNQEIRRALRINPWQLFRAKPRVLYFDVGGGGATASLTHASETDTAQSIAVIVGAVTVSVGHAAETGTAQSITPIQAAVVALGHAVETDSAQSIAVLSSITVSVSHAVESDAAQSIVPVLSSTVSVGHASETDTAQSIAAIVSGANSIGHASETDTAQTITPVPGAVTVSIGAATETSSAQAIAVLASLTVSLGTATEVGTVGAITPVPGGVIVTINAASETNSAQSITVFVPGVMTLTADDIAAIADAVWAHATAISFSDKMDICSRILRNKTVTDPTTGLMTVYADDGVTPYLTAQLHEDAAESQTYRGQGAEVRGRLA
jgi:hypothetical protein